MRIVSAVAFAIVTLAGIADAGGILASPSIYGSYAQSKGYCFIMNVGEKPVSVQADVFGESGETILSSSTSCNGGPVAPGSYCSVSVSGLSNGVAFACTATVVSGRSKYLRGTFMLTDQFFGLIRQTALR